jgi:hypothetical protein
MPHYNTITDEDVQEVVAALKTAFALAYKPLALAH